MSAELIVVGGGAMGGAIVEGGIMAGIVRVDQVLVVEPDADRRSRFAAGGMAVAESLASAAPACRSARHILLAVKPQTLGAIASELAAAPGTTIISIMAGVSTPRLAKLLNSNTRIVRAMPNMPAQVHRGLTALCLGGGSQPGDGVFAERLFSALGSVAWIDETLMDAFTAVAASGPAYIFYLAQAMIRSAVALGFDETLASSMVRDTVAGAGELLRHDPRGADGLLNAVKSKGGTTEAALHVLDAAGVSDTVVAALTAARDRGRVLGQTA